MAFCKNCGTKVDGLAFCPNCGTPVAAGAPQPQNNSGTTFFYVPGTPGVPGAPAPNPGRAAPNQGYPNPGYSARNPGYSAPNPGYSARNPGYSAPNPGYGVTKSVATAVTAPAKKSMNWLIFTLIGLLVAGGIACLVIFVILPKSNPLVGTWVEVLDAEDIADGEEPETVVIHSDGTLTSSGAPMLTCHWITEGSTLTVTTPFSVTSYTYSVSGDTLTISDDEGPLTYRRK